MMEFTFEPSAWELTLDALPVGGHFSAVRFLTLMEEETEDFAQEALAELRTWQITLDITELPKPVLTGEAGTRLQLEAKLAQKGRLRGGFSPDDPLELYLEELAGQAASGDPVLLAKCAAEGDEMARTMLVNLSLSRVVELACGYVGYGVFLLDLIQEGSLGLWECILNWTGTGDFEAYRDWWIGQTMAALVTLQARANGVGQKMRQALEDYRNVDEQLLSELGRNPTVEEIAQQLHMTVSETMMVADMLESARMIHRAKQETEEKPEDPDDSHAVEDTAYFQSRQRIEELLSGLEAAEAELLSLRFGLEGGLPMSPEDVGRRLGLTPQEVVEKEAAALAKLRKT